MQAALADRGNMDRSSIEHGDICCIIIEYKRQLCAAQNYRIDIVTLSHIYDN